MSNICDSWLMMSRDYLETRTVDDRNSSIVNAKHSGRALILDWHKHSTFCKQSFIDSEKVKWFKCE